MSLRTRMFAVTYDRMMRKTEAAGLTDRRETLLAGASGDVIEIGGGTGANLAYYPSTIRSLTVTEPDPSMVRRLEEHARSTRPGTTVLRAPAEDLPFDDASFDTAVSTLVLCGVDDQPRALRELRRVVRPGGRLVFVEHVRADDPKLARLQDRMHRLNVRVGHGCHCNRPTLDTIRSAGFEVTQLHRDTIPYGPPWIRPLIVGVAQRSAGEVAATEPLSASHVA